MSRDSQADSLCFGKRGLAKGGCGLHCVVYVAAWWCVPKRQNAPTEPQHLGNLTTHPE